MLLDFKYVFLWYFVLTSISFLSLPFIFSIFRNFWDKGYVFAKTLSLFGLSYFMLVTGIFKLIPFTTFGIFGAISIFLLLSLLKISKPQNLAAFKKIIKENGLKFLFLELLFFAILLFWSYVRAFQPDIEGLEKFMDWGFVNSMLRTQYFPPKDMWFAPEPINYYYFGHLVYAFLTKLSTIPSTITYNLSIATTAAFAFTSAFSLSSNFLFSRNQKSTLKKIIIAGLISAILLAFAGNLHPLYKTIKNIVADQGSLTLNPTAVTSALQKYWYPDATRFIGFDPDTSDKTIHEFPLYSFVVADLHGHLNDIALILFFVAFLFAYLQRHLSDSKKKLSFHPVLIIFSGFLLSIAYMTNAWDFAVYGLLFGITLFVVSLYRRNFYQAFNFTLFHGLLTILAWYIFTLPFSLNFTPMAEGLMFSDVRSPLFQLFILYGGFWLISLPLFIFVPKYYFSKLKKLTFSDLFVFSLILTATILIIIPEIGYVKDIYVFDYRRANTMFKLVYQSFILYSLAASYIFFRFRKNLPYKILFIIIFLIHTSYSYFAINSYYSSLKDYKGLYGLNFLKNTYPDNYQVVNWINQNIDGQPIILEAVGDSYTLFNHVSVSTGLPTVEGWIVHEWLWRGGYDQPSIRQNDVKKIYESDNLNSLRQLLFKYQVSYIFVGDLERDAYPLLNEQNFLDIGAKVIYQSGETRLYQLQ